MSAVRLLAALLSSSLLLGACGGSGDTSGPTLRVLAASSLTGSFDKLAERFEAQHDGVVVETVYDNSATLATQVSEGAPADVLATADLETMQRVVDAGDADAPVAFAGNTAVLVTPADNPAGITTFADLDRAGADYVVCVDTAPCGMVAAALLQRNGVTREPRSFEDNVRAVLEKVSAGEVDAGIVYVTDARAARGDVNVVDIPGAAEEATGYAIAVVAHSPHPDLAEEFVELVRGETGQQLLRGAGFGEAP